MLESRTILTDLIISYKNLLQSEKEDLHTDFSFTIDWKPFTEAVTVRYNTVYNTTQLLTHFCVKVLEEK